MKRRPLVIVLAVSIITISIVAALFTESFTIFAQDKADALVPIPKKESNIKPLDENQTIAAQEKAMSFIKNVLSVDSSKYTIKLENSDIMNGVPLANDSRKITSLRYVLTPLGDNGEKDVITVCFMFEKDVLTSYFALPLTEVITKPQYADRNATVKGFLEKYQTYTNIDSTKLLAMLDNVDLTRNYIVTKGDMRFEVTGTDLRWTYTVDGVDYTKLEIGLLGGFVRSVHDTMALYTIGDTSINIPKEQAIDIALENLKHYSYEMFDGVTVSGFNVSRDNVVATLATSPVDYELRPYWDIRIMLNEVYPGNVFGITVFLWANTGEIISYSNMATGG